MLRSHFWQILTGHMRERKPAAINIDALGFSRQLLSLQESLHCAKADPVEDLVNVSSKPAVLAGSEKRA